MTTSAYDYERMARAFLARNPESRGTAFGHPFITPESNFSAAQCTALQAYAQGVDDSALTPANTTRAIAAERLLRTKCGAHPPQSAPGSIGGPHPTTTSKCQGEGGGVSCLPQIPRPQAPPQVPLFHGVAIPLSQQQAPQQQGGHKRTPTQTDFGHAKRLRQNVDDDLEDEGDEGDDDDDDDEDFDEADVDHDDNDGDMEHEPISRQFAELLAMTAEKFGPAVAFNLLTMSRRQDAHAAAAPTPNPAPTVAPAPASALPSFTAAPAPVAAPSRSTPFQAFQLPQFTPPATSRAPASTTQQRQPPAPPPKQPTQTSRRVGDINPREWSRMTAFQTATQATRRPSCNIDDIRPRSSRGFKTKITSRTVETFYHELLSYINPKRRIMPEVAAQLYAEFAAGHGDATAWLDTLARVNRYWQGIGTTYPSVEHYMVGRIISEKYPNMDNQFNLYYANLFLDESVVKRFMQNFATVIRVRDKDICVVDPTTFVKYMQIIVNNNDTKAHASAYGSYLRNVKARAEKARDDGGDTLPQHTTAADAPLSPAPATPQQRPIPRARTIVLDDDDDDDSFFEY